MTIRSVLGAMAVDPKSESMIQGVQAGKIEHIQRGNF
jgi:hypothetical protein